MLREIKNKQTHHFRDENGDKQGEYKEWHENSKLEVHCFYVNGERHGEYKSWFRNGSMAGHCFYVNGLRHGEYKTWDLFETGASLNIHCFYVNGNTVSFDEIPYPATPEERMLFMLKYDLQLLPVENVC